MLLWAASQRRACIRDAAEDVQGLVAERRELQGKLEEAEHAKAALEERCEHSQGVAGSSAAECHRLQALLSKREDRVAQLAAQVCPGPDL